MFVDPSGARSPKENVMEPWSPDIFVLEPWSPAFFGPEPWSPKLLWDPDISTSLIDMVSKNSSVFGTLVKFARMNFLVSEMSFSQR